MHGHNENINKAIETITITRKQILELKNTINKLKILLKVLNSTVDQAEERINELEDRSFEIIESEEQK